MICYSNARYEVVKENFNGHILYLVKKIGVSGIEASFFDLEHAIDTADWYNAIGL